MGLSRLENFLKNARGNILYVSPNDLDSTDSIENKGNSLTRPFKTIQRALVEASRFSYQIGLNNDRFSQTTILLYPGDHLVDNRPGWIPDGLDSYKLRSGETSSDFTAWDLTTIYDLENADNALYKLNSVYGGVIIPRGTSIVGLDLRKTKIRPKYVPSPTNDNVDSSALFRVTGGCYFWQFTIFDSDPNGVAYRDYTENTFVPNFSHHKLSCFEYADGVNNVNIKDNFLTYSTNRTDLDMYYEKVGLAYGTASGRQIQPDYPSASIDIQPKVDEYRIVGSTGESVGITSIKAGNGTIPTDTITVTTSTAVAGLDVDTPFRVDGINVAGYNGKYVVSEKVNTTQFKYEVQNSPLDALPSVTGSTITLQSDTVTSASPYIFNCSLRSVFGMNGLHADGSRATGFKSMVVAQFTGIGLNKDDNAFVKYNPTTGVYDDNTVSGNESLSSDSSAIFKPAYKNTHIKCTNNAVIQAVSVFAIGFAEHFVVETGGDMSITNSNSNFGAKSLNAVGFRPDAFGQDDKGFITHIIPPKELPITENAIEFNAIDIKKTAGIGTTSERLYLYNQKNADAPPENVLEGYRVGARDLDKLHVIVGGGSGISSEYSSRIVMPNSQSSSQKSFNINRVAGINSITTNIITLTEPHTFENSESIRVLSDNGRLPDGLTPNTVYFAITNSNSSAGLNSTTDIKLAKTEKDAKNAQALTINNLGGTLKVVSRVSDKNSGDIGHPVQYDTSGTQWYIKVSTASTDNLIHSGVITGLGTASLGDSTSRSYIKRKGDNRNTNDITYRVRYVLPANSGGTIARPPSDGFIIQESNTSIGSTSSEIQTYFGSGSLTHINEQRNFRFIADANWSTTVANILTELPHDLSVGSLVELINVQSGVNTTGLGNSGYNGTFAVTGISSSKQFSVGITTDPGSFTNDTLTRDTTLPHYKRKKFNSTYFIKDSQETQPYIKGEQDGIYYLTLLNASNKPSVEPFTTDKFSQNTPNLYPQIDRDTPNSDPDAAISYAVSDPIGEVIVDNVKNSITRETIDQFVKDVDVGIGLTNIMTASSGSSHRFNTEIDHGLQRITKVSIASSGASYGTGVNADYYNARLVSIGSSTTGSNATAKVAIDATGGITGIVMMDGGSAYGVGNTMHVTGIATQSGWNPAVVRVDEVYDNIGDVVRIAGVTSDTYKQYNTVYRLSEVEVGAAKSFVALSDPALSGVNNTGIGSDPLVNALAYLTGESLRASNIAYNITSGIATVTTTNNHGLKVNSKVKINTGISTMPYFDGDFIVKQNEGLNSFTINVGTGLTQPVAAGSTMFALPNGVTSNDGVSTLEDESLNGRMVPTYAGITTTLSSTIADAISTDISITGIANLDLNIGDYIAVDDEILRIKTTVRTTTSAPSNPISVFRAVLGTRATSHATGSVVRKVKPFPVELRRHSINRASGHTWEYVGYGPGNYSTALPNNQNRLISDKEELLAQSTKKEGGVNFFTGMNDRGIAYSGNKKVSTVTGREEVYDSPVRSVTGEDISNKSGLNLVNATEGEFTQSIRVDGGDDGKAISEFTGPVVFSNKVTSTAARGIEANQLFLQGDATVSRKYTVGISTPTDAGTPGDVVYYENPEQGNYLGWVYTLDNAWRRFGNISLSDIADEYTFEKIGIATDSVSGALVVEGDARVSGVVTADGGLRVGTAVTIGSNGNGAFTGIVTAASFSGNGANLTDLSIAASGWAPNTVSAGSTAYYATGTRVGIGTTVPHYNLHLGEIASSSGIHTDLYVENMSTFLRQMTTENISVGGALTATSYRLHNTSAHITAGIVTASTLVVGTALSTSNNKVGLGTPTPRAKLDVDGAIRYKTSSENVEQISSSSGEVTVDLAKGQTFNLNLTENVGTFVVSNSPSDSTTFTIKITQPSGSTYSVGIDTFRNNTTGLAATCFWPGGVIPTVTQTAGRTDIYSFKSFDSCASFFGVVGGQGFA